MKKVSLIYIYLQIYSILFYSLLHRMTGYYLFPISDAAIAVVHNIRKTYKDPD